MGQTDLDVANLLNEIVRIGDEVDAIIDQGMAAGLVLSGMNSLSVVAIVDKVVDMKLVIACLVVVVMGQVALATVTWMRLQPLWARRRQLCEELKKARQS